MRIFFQRISFLMNFCILLGTTLLRLPFHHSSLGQSFHLLTVPISMDSQTRMSLIPITSPDVALTLAKPHKNIQLSG